MIAKVCAAVAQALAPRQQQCRQTERPQPLAVDPAFAGMRRIDAGRQPPAPAALVAGAVDRFGTGIEQVAVIAGQHDDAPGAACRLQ